MGYDTDVLNIISMTGSCGKGRQNWEFRRSYYQNIIGQEKPDLMLFPSDDLGQDKSPIAAEYSQFLEPDQNGTVLLYDHQRLKIQPEQQIQFKVPEVDISKLLFPSVDILSPAPAKSVVKTFQMISWHWEVMDTTSQEIFKNGRSLLYLSQLLAFKNKTEILIGGDFNLELSEIQSLLTEHNEHVSQGIESLMPHFRDFGYMDCMTRNIMSSDRRLRQLKLHKSKTIDDNGRLNYFVASKEMQIIETSTLKIERLEAKKTVIKTDIGPSVGFPTATQEINRRPNSSSFTATLQREANRTEQVTCSRERTEYPTGCRTQMYVPPRPPKHHGG